MGVLLGDVGAEFGVLPHRFPKPLVCGEPGFIQRLQVHGDKPLALLVGDFQVAVFVDQVPKSGSRLNRSGPPNDSAVNQVRWST